MRTLPDAEEVTNAGNKNPSFDLQSLSSIRKADLHTEVTAQVARMAAALQPGTRLPTERELAERLGVGRSTIRESLRSLQFIGAIDVTQGYGITVSPLENQEANRILGLGLIFQRPTVQEVISARQLLEVQVAGLAATNHDARNTEELEETTLAIWRGVDDRRSAARSDAEFHLALARASKNTVLYYLVNGMRSLIEVWMANAIHDRSVVEALLAEHDQILQAVLKRDAEAAREAMRKHLEHAAECLTRDMDGNAQLETFVQDVMKAR